MGLVLEPNFCYNLFMEDVQFFIKRAAYLAKRSPMRRFSAGAVIIKKNVIVAEGWSHIGPSLKELYSVHGEIHCLGRSRHLNLDGSTIYIATLSRKSGNLTLAKPCITCAIALASAGINTAYFTLNNNEVSSINLNGDLDSLNLYRASPGLKLVA